MGFADELRNKTKTKDVIEYERVLSHKEKIIHSFKEYCEGTASYGNREACIEYGEGSEYSAWDFAISAYTHINLDEALEHVRSEIEKELRRENFLGVSVTVKTHYRNEKKRGFFGDKWVQVESAKTILVKARW